MNRLDSLPTAPASAATGTRLHVRRACVDDALAHARIMADEAVYPMVLQMPYADAAGWRAKLASACAPESAHVPLVAVAGDEVVGTAGLFPASPSPRRRHAMKLGLSVDAAWHGRGVGTLLMQALCDYADDWLGLLRLELEVYADNHRAQSLYRRFGFVDEGVRRRDAMRAGVYVDSLAMARLHPAPLRGFPARAPVPAGSAS